VNGGTSAANPLVREKSEQAARPSLEKQTSDLVSFPDDQPVPDAEEVDASIRALAARLPAVECRIGTRSFERGVLAAECLRRLTA
jgi:hypothetical protein